MKRILLIGPFGTAGHIVHGLRDALRELGHEVRTLDHRTASISEAFGVDADVTLVFRGERIAAGVVERLPGTTVLLYAEILHPDPSQVFDHDVSRERALVFEGSVGAYDFVCYHDLAAVDTVRALGARRVLWAGIGGVGAHPSLHHRLPVEKTIDVGFVGTPSPRREEALATLRAAGIDVQAGSVRGEAYNAFAAACKVVLNVHYADLPNTEYRLFEAMGAGACCVSEAVSMPQLFREASCLLQYPLGDHDAMIAQVRRLLDDDAERARVAEAGLRLAQGPLSMRQACASLLWAVDVALGATDAPQPLSGLAPYDEAVARLAAEASALAGTPSIPPAHDVRERGSRIGQAEVWGAAPPAFSIVIPTYNRAPILRRCLDALAQQTFDASRFEVVVCDDGSTDETPALMSGYDAPYALTYVRQANAGPATARNRALRLAQGERVLILNDDAIAHPALLERHAEAHARLGDDSAAVLGTFAFTPELRRTPFQFTLTFWHLLFTGADVVAPERAAATLRGAGIAVAPGAEASEIATLLNRLVLDPGLHGSWEGALPDAAPPAEWQEADPQSYGLHLNRALLDAWLGDAVRATTEKGWMLFYYHSMRRGERHGPEYFWTCNLSLSRAAVEAVGGFDPAFPTAAAEDVDLGIRLARLGVAVVYEPACITWHDHPQTAGALGRVYRMRGEGETRLWQRHPERANGRHVSVMRRLVEEHGDRLERLEALVARIEATAPVPGTDEFVQAVSLVANVLEPIKTMGWSRGLLDGMERREAEAAARRAATPDVSDAHADAVLARAQACIDADELGEAAGMLHELLEGRPGEARALALLGDLQRCNGRPDRAAVFYERALEAQPSTEAAFYALLDVLAAHDRWGDAHVVWQRYADYIPSSVERSRAATALASRGASPAAAAADGFDGRVPGSWEDQLATAWGCLASGRPEAGVGVARRLLDRVGHEPDAMRGVADLFGQAGLGAEAQQLRRAAHSSPASHSRPIL